uniref:Uncharacterized protein n=1 Tax=Knipowitschia caucasica TaxID=637954 RepID=A0AAV2KVP3_KNICA
MAPDLRQKSTRSNNLGAGPVKELLVKVIQGNRTRPPVTRSCPTSQGLSQKACVSSTTASACEFADIVEVLLNSGADPSIKDMEGSLPEEVTESRTISSILHQFTSPKD